MDRKKTKPEPLAVARKQNVLVSQSTNQIVIAMFYMCMCKVYMSFRTEDKLRIRRDQEGGKTLLPLISLLLNLKAFRFDKRLRPGFFFLDSGTDTIELNLDLECLDRRQMR